MPPTAKLIDQVTKNENAIEEVEESDLPEPVKARVTKAITDTQKIAVDASQAWEQCKADLASENAAKWRWLGLAWALGMVGGFFVGRKF